MTRRGQAAQQASGARLGGSVLENAGSEPGSPGWWHRVLQCSHPWGGKRMWPQGSLAWDRKSHSAEEVPCLWFGCGLGLQGQCKVSRSCGWALELPGQSGASGQLLALSTLNLLSVPAGLPLVTGYPAYDPHQAGMECSGQMRVLFESRRQGPMWA